MLEPKMPLWDKITFWYFANSTKMLRSSTTSVTRQHNPYKKQGSKKAEDGILLLCARQTHPKRSNVHIQQTATSRQAIVCLSGPLGPLLTFRSGGGEGG